MTARWGMSPFSLGARGYQALGGIASGWGLTRVRTPAQMLCGEPSKGRATLAAEPTPSGEEAAAERGAALAWNESDCGPRRSSSTAMSTKPICRAPMRDLKAIAEQAAVAADEFVDRAGGELQSAVDQLAFAPRRPRGRDCGTKRCCSCRSPHLVYRFLKNFLYDSWLIEEFGLGPAKPLFGLEFFLAAGLTLIAWCALLLWSFTARFETGARSRD